MRDPSQFHLGSISPPGSEIGISALTNSSIECLKPTKSCLAPIQVPRLALQLYSFGPFHIQPGPAIWVSSPSRFLYKLLSAIQDMSHLQQGPGIGVPFNLRRGANICIPCPSRSIYEHLNPIQVTSHLLPGPVNSISPQSMSCDLHLNTIPVSRVSPPSRSRYTSLTSIQVVILGLSRHLGHVLPLSQSRDWHLNLN